MAMAASNSGRDGEAELLERVAKVESREYWAELFAGAGLSIASDGEWKPPAQDGAARCPPALREGILEDG